MQYIFSLWVSECVCQLYIMKTPADVRNIESLRRETGARPSIILLYKENCDET